MGWDYYDAGTPVEDAVIASSGIDYEFGLELEKITHRGRDWYLYVIDSRDGNPKMIKEHYIAIKEADTGEISVKCIERKYV